MLNTKAQSSSKGIILDDMYSSALLDAYEHGGYVPEKKSAPTGIFTITTLLALRMDETRHVPWAVTKETMHEALLLLSIFERVHLYFPQIHAGVDLDQLSGAGVESHLELHPKEREAWLENEMHPASVKGIIIAEQSRHRENPRSRLVRSQFPVSELFTEQDIEDLDFLRDLVLARARLDPQLAEWGDHLPDVVRGLASDPDMIPYLARTTSRRLGMTKKELTLYLMRLLLSVRDDLCDIRSLLHYSSEMGLPTTWQTSIANTKSELAAAMLNPNISDNYWIAVRALISEVQYMPAPKTVKEALSLRESREMRRLRSLLRTWEDAVRGGEIKVESEIRKALGKASAELRRAGACQNIAGMVASLALPVSVCELLLGLPPSSSLLLGALGTAFDAGARVARWRNRWFIWGNRF